MFLTFGSSFFTPCATLPFCLCAQFSWLGESAIAQWGNTVGVPEAPGMGWDGTTGDQPRGTQILYNLVHELGIWEKQSSFYFQAKSCQNIIIGNMCVCL